jgi:hypothetical protein
MTALVQKLLISKILPGIKGLFAREGGENVDLKRPADILCHG